MVDRSVEGGVRGDVVGAVMVVGGGIGGIQASLDLADSGYKVHMVESSPTIGGVMAQLDKTFPTNDCAMCIVSPKLVECGRHLNIDIMTCAQVQGIAGEEGNFSVQVELQPRSIDSEACTGCGVCARLCPARAVDTFNEGLNQRAAAYIRYPQAVPLAFAIDREQCIGCGLCENVCLADAVHYGQEKTDRELTVGSVILAPGFEEFDAHLCGEYGYGRFPNVVTSIEFERILSASGPYKGRVQRPSDGEIPTRVAFVQCVGSRDPAHGRGYCSSVCCMYATKEAVIAHEHMSQVKPTIFYMDMRCYGKDFDKYLDRAKEEYGVRYIRHMISLIRQDPHTNNLLVRYEGDDGEMVDETFDMVVLSVGFEPSPGVRELAERLGIELDEYGFCRTRPFEPLATSRSGIYVCGAFSSPKDIPETVMQASGAAAAAGSALSGARGTLVRAKEYPVEGDIRGQPPRIGVFICYCGINIGGIVDVPSVVEYAKTLPHVVYAESNLYTCSQDTQERIKETISEHGLNRVVVASCTPRTHEPLFQETLQESGLNRYLFEMANIRDQCSWVHMHLPVAATEKARDLVRMAVAKSQRLQPLDRPSLPVTPAGLVIGGGLSGMTAALALADSGYEAYLVERDKELGGMLHLIHRTLEGHDVQEYLRTTVSRVNNHPLVHVLVDAEIEDMSGYVGSFHTTIQQNGSNGASGSIEVDHGAVIVATGAVPYQPVEYQYGMDPRVVTGLELEAMMADPDGAPRVMAAQNVAMIQCVGSRNEEHPYCSRTCCAESVKNAIQIKEMNPSANVFVFYRDLRTYGLKEDYYRQAREKGVLFVQFAEGSEPVVSLEGERLTVKGTDPLSGRPIELDADIVALAVGTEPRDDSRTLAQMLKVPLNDDGFFLEAHVKLRPVEFATEGVFLCGLAHSPKFIEESIAQAKGAASRASTVLSKETIEAAGIVPTVDTSRCVACGLCEEVCAYNAIQVQVVDDRLGVEAAQVNAALCKGCGACTAGCRSGALDLRGYSDEQILAAIGAFAYV